MKFILLCVALVACDQPHHQDVPMTAPATAGPCRDTAGDIGTGGMIEFTCPHPDHVASITVKGYVLCNCLRGDR